MARNKQTAPPSEKARKQLRDTIARDLRAKNRDAMRLLHPTTLLTSWKETWFLTKLPVEVRLIIYEMLFASQEVRFSRRRDLKNELAMLQVCSTMRREALPVFHERTTAVITRWPLNRWSFMWTQAIHGLRHFTFEMDESELRQNDIIASMRRLPALRTLHIAGPHLRLRIDLEDSDPWLTNRYPLFVRPGCKSYFKQLQRDAAALVLQNPLLISALTSGISRWRLSTFIRQMRSRMKGGSAVVVSATFSTAFSRER